MSSLDHIGIYVDDLVRSIVFYGELFGYQVAHTMETTNSKIALLNVGGAFLEVTQRPDAPGKVSDGPRSHIAFKVDDYNALESKLESIGLELKKGNIGDGRKKAFFKDPDGHDVEIME